MHFNALIVPPAKLEWGGGWTSYIQIRNLLGTSKRKIVKININFPYLVDSLLLVVLHLYYGLRMETQWT